MKKGFTLIELLIVVAIIAILAAIAVPNFLEAQTRAKVSRAKNDMRTIDVGLTAYCVDNNNYPYPKCVAIDGYAATWIWFATELSTPVAYMTTTAYPDVFGGKNAWQSLGSPLFSKIPVLPYAYTPFAGCWGVQYLEPNSRRKGWLMYSAGPNRKLDWPEYGFVSGSPGSYVLNPFGAPGTGYPNVPNSAWLTIYDSTNGTVSGGDIARCGGDVPSPPPN